MKNWIILFILFNSLDALAVRGSCREPYVPPYDRELLIEVNEWGRGGAVANYAEKAGYTFDVDTYNADCPDWAVFGFGRATGTTCYELDVMGGYASSEWVLSRFYHRSINDPDSMEKPFPELFLEYAQDWKMDQYLSPMTEDPQS